MLEIAPNLGARTIPGEARIRVCIVGSNQALADACHANLQQLCPDGYHVEECGLSDAPDGCDVYVWDFEASPAAPPAMLAAGNAAKVIISKKSALSSIRRKLSGVEFTHLQAPVTSLSLRAVLVSAIARRQLGRNSEISPARPQLDSDRILQQLL